MLRYRFRAKVYPTPLFGLLPLPCAPQVLFNGITVGDVASWVDSLLVAYLLRFGAASFSQVEETTHQERQLAYTFQVSMIQGPSLGRGGASHTSVQQCMDATFCTHLSSSAELQLVTQCRAASGACTMPYRVWWSSKSLQVIYPQCEGKAWVVRLGVQL